MRVFTPRVAVAGFVLGTMLVVGCTRRPEPLGREETFHWVAQPVAFAPPPTRWYRQGDSDGRTVGVRFILTNGGGQVMSVAAYRRLPDGSEIERPTSLEEIVPLVRMDPWRKQEPERWRVGRDYDTTWADLPAFVTEDTLITPERPLLYHEVHWVVRGSAFKAVFQGMPENVDTFHRVVDTVRFPEPESEPESVGVSTP